MRKITCILLMTILTGNAFATSFQSLLTQGNELLRKGNIAGALEVYEALQVEEPNAPDLLFSLGCAQYLMADKDPEHAQQRLEVARESFEKAQSLSAGRLSVDAGYNRANALAQLAKREEDSKKKMKALEGAIEAYEQVLARNPDHAKAQHNLDHVRYELKQEEQNPPPPQEPQSGSDKEEQDQGDQQQQQQQQGGQGEQEKQQQQGDQNQQGNSKDQEKQDAQDEQSKKDAEQQQQQPSPQDPNQQPPQGQQKAAMGKEKMGDETIKSLLESLENVDQEEQKRLREAPHEQGIQEEWW